MKGQCKHEVFQELLIKKSIWKLLCAFAFVILISKRNFVRFVCLLFVLGNYSKYTCTTIVSLARYMSVKSYFLETEFFPQVYLKGI